MGSTTVRNALKYAVLPTSSATATSSTEFVTKGYVDGAYTLTNAASYTGSFSTRMPITYTFKKPFFNGSSPDTQSLCVTLSSATLTEASLLTLNLGTATMAEMAGTYTWSNMTSFVAPNLKYLLSQLSLTTLSNVTTLNFPELLVIQGSISITANSLATFNAPKLTYCGGVSIVSNALTTLNLPSLQYIDVNFAPNAPALITAELPSIIRIITNVNLGSCINITNFSFGSTFKKFLGVITINNGKLTQASVDNILVRLAALDGTNGTTAYSSKTITLSGGTSSAPSATGLAAKTTLQARGCTVLTN